MKLENGTPIIINKEKGTFVSIRDSSWDGTTVLWLDKEGILRRSLNPSLKVDEVALSGDEK